MRNENSETDFRFDVAHARKLAASGLVGHPFDSAATTNASELAAAVRGKDRKTIRTLIGQVQVLTRAIRIEIHTSKLTEKLGLDHAQPEHQTIELVTPVSLTRSGMAMRLIHTDGKAGAPQPADPALIRLLKARNWWARLADGTTDISALAREEGVSATWVSRVGRLNFLAPAIVASILDGDQPVWLTLRSIVATADLPLNWVGQIGMYKPN